MIAAVLTSTNGDYLTLTLTAASEVKKKIVTLPFLSLVTLGRFDGAVIEERRKAAEAMLQFTTSIPALYNSPQLKEFFRVRHTQRGTLTI